MYTAVRVSVFLVITVVIHLTFHYCRRRVDAKTSAAHDAFIEDDDHDQRIRRSRDELVHGLWAIQFFLTTVALAAIMLAP